MYLIKDCRDRRPRRSANRTASLWENRGKYIRQLNEYYTDLDVDSFVIMPNHIHLLLQIKENEVPESGPSGTPVPTKQNSVISRFVSTFKRFCNKEFGKNVWQSRSYDHVIRNQDDFDRHLKYIYENPFKWNADELYTNE